ncbi:universal stress protein [Nonomuraea pusilla]|uniref:universal stress protein n=1 Tax=Nonomuraea pusilla TaxID=46177 RepID=UPI0033167A9A
MTRIVVGADGGPGSEAALMWAAAETERRGARLVIVHAWESRAEQLAAYAPHPARAEPGRRRAWESAALTRAVHAVEDAFPGLPVEPLLVLGRPETALLQAARGADLLVLGSAAHRAGDGRLGAVVLSCLRWPPCPVTVVPADHVAEPRDPLAGLLAEPVSRLAAR